ncbi:MAG: Crp/Fnr family transcriptional regulator [Cocleimonas sp.]|nr:Crp/Fnr family transcriptional regulator [Cocleimonas sp.]
MPINGIRIKPRPLTQCSSCLVRGRALYQKVPKDYLNEIQQFRQHQLCLTPKTTLYQSGTVPDYLYTLYDGWMALYQTTSTGKRQILRFSLPGDFIGFQASSTGKILHSAIAITPVILCSFPRSRLKEMLNTQPPLAIQLALMESRDLALCQHHLMFSGRKNAQESIAFLLLELFHRCRLQMPHTFNEAENMIQFPITQEDIGDTVGLTNVHVNRVIRQFTQEGWIECHHKKLRIINEEKLSQIGEFDIGMVLNEPIY